MENCDCKDCKEMKEEAAKFFTNQIIESMRARKVWPYNDAD